MQRTSGRYFSIAFLAICICLALLNLSAQSFAQNPTAPKPVLTIGGEVPHPLQFTAAEFAKLPHRTVKAFNGHEKKDETYEGVLLRDLLTQAGVAAGENLRGRDVAKYVEIEAADGYKAVFALAEFDPSFQDSEIIVADSMNGAPLGEGQGPLKIVAPHDKRPGRWIRMAIHVDVRQAP